jgi:predicted HTH domain antitoxin
MALTVTIPDEILAALKLPPRNVVEEIKKELAVHLFAEGLLPEASACRLTGLSRLAFERVLGERKIPPRYSAADLDADVQALTGA